MKYPVGRERERNVHPRALRRGSRTSALVKTALCSFFMMVPITLTARYADSSFVRTADSLAIVDTVIISGNSSTKEFVIRREMTLRQGMPATSDMLLYDQNRIYSLGLFTRVDVSLEPSRPGKARVLVVVDERWHILPYPIFGLKDRDWSKVFYGFGLIHNNFRGRNEKLGMSAVFGFDPSASLSYRNSFLDDDGMYGMEAHLSVSKVRNRSLEAVQAAGGDFDEDHFGVGGSIVRRFGLNQAVSYSSSYEVVRIPVSIEGRTISPDGRDAYLWLNLSYQFDTRDLREYPADGFLANVSITKYGVFSNPLDIVRYGIDLRRYVPIAQRFLTIKGRVFANVVAGGPTPTYNRTYFGYGDRLRGHFREVYEGEDIIGMSLECDVPLLTPRYLLVSALPREFGIWRYGVVASVFADAGTTWFRGEPLALDRAIRGYGCGIHFLLPYSVVIRTEYALSESRRGEFILGIGASF